MFIELSLVVYPENLLARESIMGVGLNLRGNSRKCVNASQAAYPLG
jgi:hypothetical protein